MTPSEPSAAIEIRTFFPVPPERLWRAIADMAEFSRWFGVETADSFSPGARLRLVSINEGCRGEVFFITVEEMIAGRRLSWHWHPGLAQPGVDYSIQPMTLVTFDLEEAPGGARLTLVESGFDRIALDRRAALVTENEAGWRWQMESLTRYLAHQIARA